MALRDSSSLSNSTFGGDVHISANESSHTTQANAAPRQKSMSHVEATDVFFAALGKKLPPQTGQWVPLQDLASRSKPLAPTPSVRENRPEVSVVLQAISSLREEMHQQLDKMKQATRENSKKIEELSKPIWKKIWEVFQTSKQPARTQSARNKSTVRLCIEQLEERRG